MKTTLKTIFLSAVAISGVFTAAVYVSSCKPDKCHSVVCDNGGTCDGNGNCVCPTGFEGTSCETPSRSKFIGNWGVTNSTTTTEPARFGVSIASSAGSVTNVTISNLHDFFTQPVNAIISGDSIIIPDQLVQGNFVSGGGAIYSTSAYSVNSNITMIYQVTDTTTKMTVIETEDWSG